MVSTHRATKLCLAGALLVLGFSTQAPARTMDEVLAPLRSTAGGCSRIDGIHAWSMQARSLYETTDMMKTFDLEVREKTRESYECGKQKATVYLYAFDDSAKAQSAFGFISSFVWGEKQKSEHHPEDIIVFDNIVAVISGQNLGPVTEVLTGKRGSPPSKSNAKIERELEKAKKAYLKPDYPQAEKRFRALTGLEPDTSIYWVYLGHSLFYQDCYSEAVPAYERAKALEGESGAMSRDEVRILNDQLGMSYGLSGDLDQGKKLFEGVIEKDPDYPMYYYMLACTVAEQGDLDGAIANLRLGFDRRANMIGNETYPNPRTDDSFRRFLGNGKFEAALKEMGF